MNAIVVVLDSLHIGYLGCYGNQWISTPHLDRLASRSVVFDQYFASDLDVEPNDGSSSSARVGMATGRYVFPEANAASAAGHPAWPEVLSAAGVHTALITDGEPFAVGFTEVIRVDRLASASSQLKSEDETSIARIVRSSMDWLSRSRGLERSLVWIESAALRCPWDAPLDALGFYGDEEDRSLPPPTNPAPGPVGDALTADELDRIRKTYAAQVTVVDRWLGELVACLDETGGETLLIVTGAQGFPLGEHDMIGGCRPWLYEEWVHLPLIVRCPPALLQPSSAVRPSRRRVLAPGMRIQAMAQAVDLCPTVLDYFGAGVPGAVHGKSWLPLFRSEVTKLRDYAAVGCGQDEWAMRTHHWHLLLPLDAATDPDRSTQLYAKPEDRWEQNDLAPQRADVAEHLELQLRRFAHRAARNQLDRLPPLRETVLMSSG